MLMGPVLERKIPCCALAVAAALLTLAVPALAQDAPAAAPLPPAAE